MKVMEVFGIAGVVFLGYYAIVFMLFIFERCCRKNQNLLQKYGTPGKKTYAVVTGGSDGIGLEICH
jgi:hypothetical protein